MCSTYLKSTILNKIPSDIRLCIPQPQTLEKERDAERKPEFFDRSDETWLLKVLRIEGPRFTVEIFLRKAAHRFGLNNSLLNVFKLAIRDKIFDENL